MSEPRNGDRGDRADRADRLGHLFARLRDEVETPADTASPPAAAGDVPAPGPEEAPAEAPAGGGVAPGPLDVSVVDEPGDEPGDEPQYEVAPSDLIAVGPVEPEPHWPTFAVAESTTLDDTGLRRRRDAALDTTLATLAPRVKRLLQDEQNELLDAIRRQKGKGDPLAALPDEAVQRGAWTDALRPAVDDCYAAGRVLGGGRTRPAPDDLVEQLVALLVLPLRERVTASLEAAGREGPYDSPADQQRAVASAVGARYREWRGQHLDAALGDLASWAFARGVFDATPDGTVMRWVPAEVEQCPDADDNALEPVSKGRPFPTGQSCPPAHAGCRCLVVPAPTDARDGGAVRPEH